jgi:CxxC motif-containing protein (DUF1111 family)
MAAKEAAAGLRQLMAVKRMMPVVVRLDLQYKATQVIMAAALEVVLRELEVRAQSASYGPVQPANFLQQIRGICK